MAYTSIDNPELYFQCKLWSGNNSGSGISITLDGDEDMSPDLVWIKARENTHAHVLYDSVRTSPANYLLQPNNAIAERTAAIASFDSDGVTFSDNDGFYNGDETYVGWFWKESVDAGLDIVSWSGTGSAKTESHSLSAVPHWIWNKNRADATQHNIYHHKNTSNPETEIMYMNLSNATTDDNAFWNDTAPTSSVFSVGADNGANGSSDAMITYLWTEKQGFSKFGTFISNNTSNNAFIYTGFAPAMVITKSTTSTNNWVIQDIKRPGYNPAQKLYPDLSNTEDDDNDIDFLSNGFKMRGALGANTFIYMAFAESPFVNSNGVPCNAR